MNCPICHSSEITFIKDFVPYTDRDWTFPVYDCNNCLSRYAVRDNENYHNLLHKEKDKNNYQLHYQLASQVTELITANNLKGCERLLRKDNFMHGQVIDFIAKYDNPRVLELGCSSGYFTAFLNAKGIKTYGVDISETAISEAKNLFPEYANFFSEAPLHKTYDIVFHKGLLSCVDNPVEFININQKMVNPMGGLIFNMSNVKSVRKLGEIWASTPPPDVVFLFHERSLRYLIKDRAHFKIEQAKYINYFLLLKKYVSLLKKRSFNKYPRAFSKTSGKSSTSFFVSAIVKTLALVIKVLVRSKLLKSIDEDFGTVIKLTKV